MEALRKMGVDVKVDLHLITLICGFIGLGYVTYYRVERLEVDVRHSQEMHIKLQARDTELSDKLIRFEERNDTALKRLDRLSDKIETMKTTLDAAAVTINTLAARSAYERNGVRP